MNDLGFSYIGNVNCSSKLLKGVKYGIDTFIVYLAPYKMSGHNVCAGATKECIVGCLNTSGRAAKWDGAYEKIINARINRTKLFYSNRELFMELLIKEISIQKKRSERKGNIFTVRLNGTSDLTPEIFKYKGKNILEMFEDVKFYDYTKIANRIDLLKKYPNYDLTYSFSGYNWHECEKMLNSGIRVAAVFDVPKNRNFPPTHMGYKVIDGDIIDYRIADPCCIVGLRWKNIKDKNASQRIKNSSFVIKPEVDFQVAA